MSARETALDNLARAVRAGESQSVISDYEILAWRVGATPDDTETAIQDAAEDFARRVTIVPAAEVIHGS